MDSLFEHKRLPTITNRKYKQYKWKKKKKEFKKFPFWYAVLILMRINIKGQDSQSPLAMWVFKNGDEKN